MQLSIRIKVLSAACADRSHICAWLESSLRDLQGKVGKATLTCISVLRAITPALPYGPLCLRVDGCARVWAAIINYILTENAQQSCVHATAPRWDENSMRNDQESIQNQSKMTKNRSMSIKHRPTSRSWSILEALLGSVLGSSEPSLGRLESMLNRLGSSLGVVLEAHWRRTEAVLGTCSALLQRHFNAA